MGDEANANLATRAGAGLSAPKALTVADLAAAPQEYRGQRFVTLAQVDRLHGRVDGTAKRNYQENKDKLVNGVDYHLVDYAQKDEFRRFGVEVPPRGLIVLAETGYLMLVKSLQDDIAWEVQRGLVSSYFRAKAAFSRPAPTRHITARQVAADYRAWNGLAKYLGLDDNQAKLSAARATRTTTGVDPLTTLGVELVAPQQDKLLAPTDLGIELGGKSGKAVNLMLQAAGFQTSRHDAHNVLVWDMTERGMQFGVLVDVNKSSGRSTVRQIRWQKSVLPILRGEVG